MASISSAGCPCAGLRGFVLALALCGGGVAQARWSHSIDYVGLSPQLRSFEGGLSDNIASALGLWTQHLAGGASLQIEVELTDRVERAAGYSLTSGPVGWQGAVEVFEQGMAFEIRTGTDPNADQPDLRILLNPGYLHDELWLDPEPLQRIAPLPQERIDAVSLFAHEIGHALAFNGWWHGHGSARVLPYASTWDVLTAFDGTQLWFVGGMAMQLHGGPVPVTPGNNGHIGTASGPGADLSTDLMNGIALERGRRYEVSALGLAMLTDMGVALAPVPEPGTALLMLGGLAVVVLVRRRRPAGRTQAVASRPGLSPAIAGCARTRASTQCAGVLHRIAQESTA